MAMDEFLLKTEEPMSDNEPEVTAKILSQIETRLMADGRLTDEERDLLHRMVARWKEAEAEKLKPIERLVSRITEDGVLTKDELQELHEAVMADGEVSSEEMMVLQGLVAKLSRGELTEK